MGIFLHIEKVVTQNRQPYSDRSMKTPIKTACRIADCFLMQSRLLSASSAGFAMMELYVLHFNGYRFYFRITAVKPFSVYGTEGANPYIVGFSLLQSENIFCGFGCFYKLSGRLCKVL